MLFLPPSVLLLSYSSAPRPSSQLILAGEEAFPKKKKLRKSFFRIFLPGVQCFINTAFILCSCTHLHHHICCSLEPGSPGALYSSLLVTSPLNYLLFPCHHTINRLHQWRFYAFLHVMDKDIKTKNTGATLPQIQPADDLQLHLETCQ